MRKDLMSKILLVSFYSNLLFIIVHVFFLITMIIIPSKLIHFIQSIENNFTIRAFSFLITIPTLFLLIYNIWFAYKNDRYSKALLYLFIFQSFYSPYYFYQNRFKKRKLTNHIEYNSDNKTFITEDYLSEDEYRQDLKKLP